VSERIVSHTPEIVAFEYLATSGAKSDIIFLLGTPISYKGDEVSCLPSLVFEI